MTGRPTALLLVAVGAVLAFVAYGRPWVVASTQTAGLPTVSHEVSGRDLQTGAGFLPLLLLAALLALWATAGWWRRAVGAVVVVAGLALAVGAVRGAHPSGAALAAASGLGGDLEVTGTAWWVAGLAGGLLAAAGGLLASLGGHRWAGMASRYGREAPARPRTPWEVLDAGGDPTVELGEEEGDPPEPPGRRGGDGSGTMARGSAQDEPEGT